MQLNRRCHPPRQSQPFFVVRNNATLHIHVEQRQVGIRPDAQGGKHVPHGIALWAFAHGVKLQQQLVHADADEGTARQPTMAPS